MFNLILAILLFAVVLVLFKLFERYKVDNLQAIVVNYLVAGSIGYAFYEDKPGLKEIINYEWVVYASIIGLLFILVFNLLAFSTQVIGFAISTIANKMSVILPVIASIYLYNESTSALKIVGILLAIIGVKLSSTNGKKLSFQPMEKSLAFNQNMHGLYLSFLLGKALVISYSTMFNKPT